MLCLQVPFQPTKAIIVGVDVLLTVRISSPFFHYSLVISGHLDRYRSECELRRARRLIRMCREFPRSSTYLYRDPFLPFNVRYCHQNYGRSPFRAFLGNKPD
jgi:hypothetical protein